MVSIVGLMVITAIPTVTGVAQAVSAQRNRDQKEKDQRRMKKFHVDVQSSHTTAGPPLSGRVVLKNGRLWIGPADVVHKGTFGYVAEAFYIEYPDLERAPAPMGLVSQVADDPPLLNWIYVDKDTMELKYGNKTASIAHHVGPWDWSEDERQVVFDDMEAAFINAFYAVETSSNHWQLFFDFAGDELKAVLPGQLKRRLVELHRSLIVVADHATS